MNPLRPNDWKWPQTDARSPRHPFAPAGSVAVGLAEAVQHGLEGGVQLGLDLRPRLQPAEQLGGGFGVR